MDMLCNKNHKNAKKKYEFISYLENNYVMELVRHHSWTYFQRLEFGFNENSKWRWGPCSKICPSWFTVKQKLVMDILMTFDGGYLSQRSIIMKRRMSEQNSCIHWAQVDLSNAHLLMALLGLAWPYFG